MNRYLILAFLIVFVNLTNFFWYAYIQESAIQEIHTSDNNDSNGYPPLDNMIDGKHNTIIQHLIVAICIVLSLTKSINLLIELKKRYVILTPIFHQSNYVDTPLLK